LSSAAADARVKGKLVVPEVIGQIKDMRTIEDTGLPDFIKSECTSREKKFDIDILDLASLPSEDQEAALARNSMELPANVFLKPDADALADALIQDRISSSTADDSFTILFLSTPNEPSYEPEFAEPIHVEHKRHLQASNVRRSDNDTEWEKLPLFEKYQFFTPGIHSHQLREICLCTDRLPRHFHGSHHLACARQHSRCWYQGIGKP
jgi:hypothetical protein